MVHTIAIAPGHPGDRPTRSPGDKQAVGTALLGVSRDWFTLGQGVLTEVYYPSVDNPCTKSLSFLVCGTGGILSEEKQDTRQTVEWLETGVPAFVSTNECVNGRYRIIKEVISGPELDAVLQRVTFEAREGALSDDRLFAMLVPPSINQHGWDNTAWVGHYKGIPMLFASQDDAALALACSSPWAASSAGFVGASNGYQDLRRNKHLANRSERAENGHVALTGNERMRFARAIAALFVLLMSVTGCGGRPNPSPQPAPAVHLERLAGLWYEIARLPFPEEQHCAGAVVDFRPGKPGRAVVVSYCWYKSYFGPMRRSASALAVTDHRTKTKLKMGLFGSVPMDIWVLHVSRDYRHAVLGTPDYRHLWILDRSPRIHAKTYASLTAVAARAGYDVARLTRASGHGEAPPPPMSAQDRPNGNGDKEQGK